INGKPVDATGDPGSYLHLTRAWHAGDRIEMEMPMRSRWEVLPDRRDVGAIVHGPIVLAQQLPLEGIPPELMHEQGPKLEKIAAMPKPAALPRDLPDRLKPVPGKPLHFAAEVEDRTVKFSPVTDSWERYTIYSPIA